MTSGVEITSVRLYAIEQMQLLGVTSVDGGARHASHAGDEKCGGRHTTNIWKCTVDGRPGPRKRIESHEGEPDEARGA